MRIRVPSGPVLLLVALLPGSPVLGSEPSGSIEGRVRSTSNEVVTEAQIAVQPGRAEVTVNADGSFEIRGLAPGSYRLTVSADGYSPYSQIVAVTAGETVEHDVVLTPAFRSLGEITVSSSFSLNRRDPSPGVALDRQQLLELPHLGDDVIRALPLLPGVASGDSSAQFNVRGGLFRELLFQLDGLEIYEPFHLEDFGGVFSIIDPRLLDEVRLLPGGFTAEYGDRSAAVLDLRTVEPGGDFTGEVGISLITMWVNGQGGFADDRGGWFTSLRRGYLDLILDLVGPEEEETERREGNGPAYYDFNAKLSYDLSEGHRLTGRILWSEDTNDQEEWEIEDGVEEYEFWDTSYGNKSFWLVDDWVLTDSAFVTTLASVNRVDRDRIVAGEDYNGTSSIRDVRESTVLGLRQDWSYQASTSHFLKWGVDVRRYDATYDYRNEFVHFDGAPQGRAFAGEFTGTNYGLYVADRFRVSDRLTAEVGARWDRSGLTDEDHLSPRLNLVWSPGERTVVRAGWGHFYQSQRPSELQVEDGETEFSTAERSEHRTLGLDHWWPANSGSWNLRVEAYQRRMQDLRVRYENLFDPFPLFPETSYDRYSIAPDSAEAVGLELFLDRRGGGRFDWWVNYSWSEVTDRIDGRDVPRQFDQTHAVTLSATWRPSPVWTVAGAWIYHTGWPTTAVAGELVDNPAGETTIVPVLGPINDERLPDYHRLDLRVSRRFQLERRGAIELFLDMVSGRPGRLPARAPTDPDVQNYRIRLFRRMGSLRDGRSSGRPWVARG
jgi:outer membrane receptor protein involved in Fe transport